MLTAWQERQRFERRSWGPAYRDSGRVFTYEDGRPLRPGGASMLRAAKVEIKVISEILGHGSTSFTDDFYTIVAEELAQPLGVRAGTRTPRLESGGSGI